MADALRSASAVPTHSARVATGEEAVEFARQNPSFFLFPGTMMWDDESGSWQKRPLVRWTSAASNKPEDVHAMWNAAGGRAVICIACSPSQIFVLDQDRDLPNDADGDEWRLLLDEIQASKATRILRSCTRGRPHLFFKQSDDWVAEGLWPGGEVKSSGMVVVSTYEPIVDAPIAYAPKALLDKLKRGRSRPYGEPSACTKEEMWDWLLTTPDYEEPLLDAAASARFLESVLERLDEKIDGGEHRRLATRDCVFQAAIEASAGCYSAETAYESIREAYRFHRESRGERGDKGWSEARERDYDLMWQSLVPRLRSGVLDDEVQAKRISVAERYALDFDSDEDVEELISIVLVASRNEPPSQLDELPLPVDDPLAPISSGGWPAVIPLTAARSLPSFPVHVFPPVIRDFLIALAEFTQTDTAMGATAVLGVVAGATGGRAEVVVREGWHEPTNLFLVAIAEPGERKSPVQQACVAPLLDAEKTLVEASERDRAEKIVLREVAEQSAEKALKVAGTAKPADKEDSAFIAVCAALDAAAIEVPPAPRLVADDITPEALGSALAEQDGRLAIHSAEGGIFDIVAGRYNKGAPNLDVFLKGHSGDMLRVDRKGRPSEFVAHPALTVCVMTQPSVLRTIGANPHFRGRGLVARFMFAIPRSIVGRRDVSPPSVPPSVRAAYRELVMTLVATMAGWKDPALLNLEPEAEEALVAFSAEIEPQLRRGASLGHIRDWASKLVGATARIAGNLHLAADPANAWRHPIGVESIRGAIEIARFFLAHALAAFDEMTVDEDIAAALYVADVLSEWGRSEFSGRDLFTSVSRSRFPKAADLEPVLRCLEEHNIIRRTREVPKRRKPGRPPSTVWEVNPAFLAAETAETAKLVESLAAPQV